MARHQHEPATITVAGRAVLRIEPDEAIVWIRLSALEDSPGRALADLAERSERLVADRRLGGVRVRAS